MASTTAPNNSRAETPNWLLNSLTPPALPSTPQPVSHPALSPYAQRVRGRNNRNWLNVFEHTVTTPILSARSDVLRIKLVSGRRWVSNFIILGWPEDEHRYMRLAHDGPIDRFRRRSRIDFCLMDEQTVFQYRACRRINLAPELRWETLHDVNDIPDLTVVIWD